MDSEIRRQLLRWAHRYIQDEAARPAVLECVKIIGIDSMDQLGVLLEIEKESKYFVAADALSRDKCVPISIGPSSNSEIVIMQSTDSTTHVVLARPTQADALIRAIDVWRNDILYSWLEKSQPRGYGDDCEPDLRSA